MLPSRALRLGLAVAVGFTVASMAPALAAASQRYVSPGGSGTACTASRPCGLVTAVGNAADGDEVIVAPGDYTLTTSLSTPRGITIHGVAGQRRPRVQLSGARPPSLALRSGSTLRYAEIAQVPWSNVPPLYASGGSIVDQVIARASGSGATASIENGEVRNSIVVASGPGGVALLTSAASAANTSTYRNVTAIASGSAGVAIEARSYAAAGTATAHVVNVVAGGSTALKAATLSTGGSATIAAAHSSYQRTSTVGAHTAIADLGGNQTFPPPAFRNAALGDYRQAPGSATINAGVDDAAAGAFDVDGDPRRIGTTDIGADEFVPAPFAGVRLVATRLTYRRRAIALALSCPSATTGGCSGRATLTAGHVRLGRASFAIAAGGQAKVRLPVARAGRRLLQRAHRLRGTETTAARDAAGHARTTVAAVKIRR